MLQSNFIIIRNFHCGIENIIKFYFLHEKCYWNCNKCGQPFEANWSSYDKKKVIIIKPTYISKKNYKKGNPVYYEDLFFTARDTNNIGIDHNRYEMYLTSFMENYINNDYIRGERITSFSFDEATYLSKAQRDFFLKNISSIMKW